MENYGLATVVKLFDQNLQLVFRLRVTWTDVHGHDSPMSARNLMRSEKPRESCVDNRIDGVMPRHSVLLS